MLHSGMHKKMKLVISGSLNCGKSTIANFLSQNEVLEKINYSKEKLCRPTVGCRIVEMSLDGIDIELWDTSGSHDFEKCWPAVMEGSTALILVYNPEELSQENDIELWYDTFAKKHGKIPKDRCLVLMYFKEQLGQNNVYPPQSSLQGCHIHRTNAEEGKELKEYFKKFIQHLPVS